jgi:hypothetical protein
VLVSILLVPSKVRLLLSEWPCCRNGLDILPSSVKIVLRMTPLNKRNMHELEESYLLFIYSEISVKLNQSNLFFLEISNFTPI